jgi:hypothetical protein
MIINKENIEEYLLLLIDGELSAAEEGAVMAFVESHEEYRLMLDAYLDTKLEPEPLVFDGKESLLKEAPQVLPLKRNKPYMVWAAALAVIIGIDFIVKIVTEREPSLPATVAVNHTPVVKPTTSAQQSLAVVQAGKVIEKKPDQANITKAKKVNTVTVIASNAIIIRPSVDAIEPLPVADYRIANVENVPVLAASAIASSTTPIGEHTIDPETDNKLFGNSEKLDLINALASQVETMKDNVQEKTKGLRIAAIAIRFGNKEYTIGKSFR